MTRAPLRFLLIVLVLWTGARVMILLPDWSGGISPVPTAAATPQPSPPVGPPRVQLASEAVSLPHMLEPVAAPRLALSRAMDAPPAFPITASSVAPAPPPASQRPAQIRVAALQPPALAPPPPHLAPTTASRWSVSAWLLVRDEGGASLAPGGTLGGSQAGGRVTYALGGGFALSGRAYLPLRRRSGAEATAGIDWRPVAALPVNLLAERRQRLGRDGRNAFALTVYGGTSRQLTPRIRVDVYAQAGIVGLNARDPFVDGAARLSRRVGPVEVGAAAWGAAQPGAARLDAGPIVSWRLPVRAANLRLQADWRFRVAGDAAPRSGPALTLAADF